MRVPQTVGTAVVAPAAEAVPIVAPVQTATMSVIAPVYKASQTEHVELKVDQSSVG